MFRFKLKENGNLSKDSTLNFELTIDTLSKTMTGVKLNYYQNAKGDKNRLKDISRDTIFFDSSGKKMMHKNSTEYYGYRKNKPFSYKYSNKINRYSYFTNDSIKTIFTWEYNFDTTYPSRVFPGKLWIKTDSFKTHYVYDSNGRKIHVYKASAYNVNILLEQIERINYNDLGNKIRHQLYKSYYYENTPVFVSHYMYNEDGKLIQKEDTNYFRTKIFKYSYTDDSLKSIKLINISKNADCFGICSYDTFLMEFDSYGSLISRYHINCNQETCMEKFVNIYENGRLVQISTGKDKIKELYHWSYNSFGQIIEYKLISNGKIIEHEEYKYSKNGLLIEYRCQFSFMKFAYKYYYQ